MSYDKAAFTIGKSCGVRMTTAKFSKDDSSLKLSANGGIDGIVSGYEGGKGGLGQIVLKEGENTISILDSQNGTGGLGAYGGQGGLGAKIIGGGGGGGGSGGLGGTPLIDFFGSPAFLSILNIPVTLGIYGEGGHGSGSDDPNITSDNGRNGRTGRDGILGIGGDGGGGGGGGGGGSEEEAPGNGGYGGSRGLGGNGFALVIISHNKE